MHFKEYKKQFCDKEQRVIFTDAQQIEIKDEIIDSLFALIDRIRNNLCLVVDGDHDSYQGSQAHNVIDIIDGCMGNQDGFDHKNRVPKSCEDFSIEIHG